MSVLRRVKQYIVRSSFSACVYSGAGFACAAFVFHPKTRYYWRMHKKPRTLARTALALVGILALVVGVSFVLRYMRDSDKAVRPFPVKNESASLYTNTPAYIHPLVIGSTTIAVAYAKTDAERGQGLSDSAPLGQTQGMLFFFDQPERPSFWMKDMHYSLDMIWIGEDMIVKDITQNATPESFPNVFFPKELVKYVLEVPAGFAEAHSIVVGTKVVF